MTRGGSPSSSVRRVKRAPAVALLAAGCALAAAAAGTGPYLSSRPVPDEPLRELFRETAEERQRRLLGLPVTGGADVWWLRVLDVLLIAVFAAALLYGLWRAAKVLHALFLLRLGTGAGWVRTKEYDPGEESHEDAVTALRKRVADELTALSADLDTVTDPREVVIACYARMERVFADAGSARRPDEAPLELLARVLAEQYVPADDVRRLTALFNEARFSTHAVTEDMRDAARRSLRSIADSLAVPG